MRHRVAFVVLALAIVVADQVTKSIVVSNAPLGRPVQVLGDWLRIWYVHNSGALFGLFPDQAPAFALLSIGVIALIVWYHERAVITNGRLATLTLGLLLGGALGNFIDRIRLGHVVDFVDMGFPGGWRFYTWNIADSAITISICLLLLMAVLPIAQPTAAPRPADEGAPVDAARRGPAGSTPPEARALTRAAAALAAGLERADPESEAAKVPAIPEEFVTSGESAASEQAAGRREPVAPDANAPAAGSAPDRERGPLG